MKRTILFFLAVVFCHFIHAQPKLKGKKYPSLLWEISGNGLKKPSFLIGTMHVSSKMAFHLPDSFYYAVKNAQVVALETNPETWQEDMSKYDLGNDDNPAYGDNISMPNDYFNINTLKFYKYDKKIERSLYSNPSTINNLLYRSFGNASSDFEEDTYLDMYIFQCGKKWGKKVAGVENYGESMKLMTEAYKDAAKDKNKKNRSYDGDEDYSSDKIQEAYRTGNLDLLDSINRYNSFSDAFDEKFLYKRNEIQANSIDSIIKTGSALFAGVGAAHLPGNRGVIELLRKRGYKLRPVKMGERDSRDKEEVDKLRVPVIFKTETADDGLFKVDIPGKFYKMGDDGALDQRQYADMSNGSYYMVTRVMTNAWMWGHTTDDVYKTIDSLLYENIPGKIISRTAIIKNGYKGLDITNRTRRGDLQRYNIFITPFEIIFFKMSGNSDYVKKGDEASRFFGSIQFKEYKNSSDQVAPVWKKYSPPYGGFEVEFPHEPYCGNDGSWIYDSEDKTTATHYRIMRSDINNYHFVDEDSFDLSLMDESFKASDFVDTQVLRKQTNYKRYPAMDCKYLDKAGSVYLTRFIIQGPHYYTLVAYGKKETAAMDNFLNSFELKPFVYKQPVSEKDTSLYFTVSTPVFPESKKIKLSTARNNLLGNDDDDDETESDELQNGIYRNKMISNDSTGEKIYVSFYHSPKYYYAEDSLEMEKNREMAFMGDTSWIIKSRKKTELLNKMKILETVFTDSGSSRALWVKSFYKDGTSFSLISETDTLTQSSSFVKNFYETFLPVDTLKGVNPFTRKSNQFFADLMSMDSATHKLAIKHIDDIDLDSADLTQLKKAVQYLNWREKKYLDIKKLLINKFGDISTNASADYLKELYFAAGDTVELQYAALESLLQQQTAYSFNVFRDIINAEPPVLDFASRNYKHYNFFSSGSSVNQKSKYDNGNFLDELYDSLELTKTILPDLLPLLNLDDYKKNIMQLLGDMVDSNLITRKDYDMYFGKFLLEAKQELKKQVIAEKKKAIEKAEEEKKDDGEVSRTDDDEKDAGNEDLSLYATLLLPWWETNTSVQLLIRQMLMSNDEKLKYNTTLLLIRNNKSYDDSLLTYFGGLDDYRYELYTDLKEMKKLDKFPALYLNHLDLGRSSLFEKKSSGKPDSLLYLDRVKAEVKGKKGYIYFYKYKIKKDDLSWKLAMVGLVPEDPKKFEFDPEKKNSTPSRYFSLFNSNRNTSYNLTKFTDTKVSNDEPLNLQLNKELKKLLYSLHKSGKEFYEEDDGDDFSRRLGFGN